MPIQTIALRPSFPIMDFDAALGASPVSSPDARDASEALDPAMATPLFDSASDADARYRSLPSVLWGEVAKFLPLPHQLMIKGIDRAARAGADLGVHTLTLSDPARLSKLKTKGQFEHLRSLTLRHCGDKELHRLQSVLADKSSARIALTLAQTHVDPPFTADGLTRLQRLDVRSIHFLQCPITASSAQALAQVPMPIALFGLNDVSSTDLRAVADIPTLTSMTLQRTAIDAETATAFAGHAVLTTLRLEHCVLASGAGAALAQSTTITDMGIVGATVDEAVYHALAANKTLTSLRMGAPKKSIKAAALTILSANATLTHLDLFLRGGAGRLASMPRLSSLRLRGYLMSFSMQDAAALATSAGLRHLHLDGDVCDGAALLALARAPSLTQLTFSQCEFDPEHVKALTGHPRLSCLTIRESSITVEQAMQLAAHPMLDTLGFESDEFTQNDIAKIAATWTDTRRSRASLTLSTTSKAAYGVRG